VQTLFSASEISSPMSGLDIMTQQAYFFVAVGAVILLVLVAAFVVRGRRKSIQPPMTATTSNIYCEQCGTQNSTTDQFCTKCGGRLYQTK
jgi:hypothetical protein